MSKDLRLLSVAFLLSLLTISLGMAQSGTTMYVSGRHLYSAVGEKVVFRGVNEMFIWSGDKQGKTILPQIEKSGANVVRLVWLSSGTPADLDSLINNCIKNKMIPLVDMHDATGNWGNIQTCLNYMKRADVVSVMNKYKKWVVLNIANEAGDANVTNTQFQTTYIDAVAQLRSVGYTFPFVIDAADWGKNENYITNTWAAIQQSDPQRNCLFSIHPYWVEDMATQQTRFTNLMNAVVSNNIPLIIGEGPEAYGYNCTSAIPYVWMMQQLQTNQVGWLVWSWGTVQNGDCTGIRAYDITSNGQYGSWQSDWGRLVVSDDPNSIKNTSIRPPSILGTLPPDTQAPTSPTAVVVSTVTPLGATLTWGASTDNVGVTAYHVYSGTALLGTTTTTNLTLTNLTCNTAYAFTIRAKDATGNVSATSNPVSATTGLCDTQAPTTPTALVTTSLLPASVGLSWGTSTDNVGVTGYRVYQGSTLLATVSGTTYNAIGLTCKTAHAFSVRAIDAAGNVSGTSNTLSLTTAACPTGEMIYADAINSLYQDWSWSCYRNINATPALEGSYSLRVDYGGYGGVSLRRNTALITSANAALKFWVYSTTTSPLQVYTQSTDSGGNSSVVNISTTANQWKEITVTMAQLGNPSQIQRINIQEGAGSSPTIFLDYVRFESSTLPVSDTVAPSVPATLAASGLTMSGLTLSWAAATDNVGVTGYQVYQNGTLLNGNVTGASLVISGLSCKTAYSFTVKAFDAAGNVSGLSAARSVTTSACSNLVIYDETLATDWQDWSWSTTNNLANTSPVKVGTKSAKVTYSAWSGFSLRKSTSLNTISGTVLKFWIQAAGSNSIKVSTNNADSGGESAGYVFNTTNNQWVEVSVTMAQLGNPGQIKRINIQNNSANSPIIYLDNIRLISVSSARVATESTAEMSGNLVLYPNPSDGRLSVDYTSPRTQAVQLRVLNASGSELHRQTEQAAEGANTFRVDMPNQTDGLYWLQLIPAESSPRVGKWMILR